MAYDDKVRLDLLCDAGDLASRFAHAQSGGGRKAHSPQPLRTFVQYFLEGLDLLGNRDEAALERSTPRTYLGDRQQEYRCVAELGNFRPLPQGTPAFDRAVIGKKHFVVQGILPSTGQGILNRYPRIAVSMARLQGVVACAFSLHHAALG
jgi:hypothetical protein